MLAAVGALVVGIVGVVVVSPSAEAASIDTNAYYVLVNRNSGKVLDVTDTSTADGAPLQQWSRNDGAWQQFRFVSSGSGWYRLQNRNSGKVVDLWEWNTADGAEYRQWPDLNATNQQFRVLDSDSGYVRLINRHSNKAMEVWQWSTADGGRISQYADLNGANQQWQLVPIGGGNPGTPQTGLVGWATQNGGTTGGGSAATTTVTSASALSSAVGSASPAVIRVSGTISCSGMLRVRSHKTILGIASATISGCGFTVSGDRNVIIRNLNFRNWNDDAINVEQSATNIWIDHNSFTNGYDGAIDIKRGSDLVTVSWNRIYGHDKSMLLGHSDSNGSQDIGHLRVTYHHNWFDGSNQRHPRVRFGNPVHVYNNLYSNVGGYGVASTMNAGVLVEGNYFENTADPYHRGEAASGPGSLVARDNCFVNSGSGQAGGSVAGIPYPYQMDTACTVKAVVSAGAGAGRIGV
ncbi:RICIN domain-containing protein [Micromonospora sp. NPDC050980]|uniref:pectate lyase family protein n=1 Tax=Micromonospora sp. NPDC050980 TaxID=3155161 RepID=UPI0033FE3B39